MEWILIIGIVLISIYCYIKKTGNLSFWNIANKHPSWAHDYFIEHPDGWYVIYPGENKGKPAGDWRGPFFITVPEIGRIKVYGKTGVYELQQKEFKGQIEVYGAIRNAKAYSDYKNKEKIAFKDVYEQYKFRTIGELVLFYATSYSHETLNYMFLDLPKLSYCESLIDDINENAYTESFWMRECYGSKYHMNVDAIKYTGRLLNDEDSLGAFNAIVLNFAIGAARQPAMMKFIKRAIKQ
ncbi:MAG: hypothetical protein LBQ01_04545 [Prevotellaceae bacterium]|jgi:hypothetical protein|nr:hypothetical protein [Prevotellaceae bacterium]